MIGDAIASFNPIYGQGMSVAALEELVLHNALAIERDGFESRYFEQVADVVDTAWKLAIGADFAFPQTECSKPRETDLVGWHFSRLIQRSHTDGDLTARLFRVLALEEPPSALFSPGVLWRVFSPFPRYDATGGGWSDHDWETVESRQD